MDRWKAPGIRNFGELLSQIIAKSIEFVVYKYSISVDLERMYGNVQILTGNIFPRFSAIIIIIQRRKQ